MTPSLRQLQTFTQTGGGGRAPWKPVGARLSGNQVVITFALSIVIGAFLLAISSRWTPSSEDAWILGSILTTGVIWAGLLRRAMWGPRTIFEPRSIYPAVYAGLFTVGTWNITARGGEIDPSILKYFGLGLVSYYLGGLLFEVVVLRPRRLGNQGQESCSPPLLDNGLRRCANGLVMVGLASLVLAWISVGGVPVFDETLRLGLNSYLVALSQSSWVGLLLSGSSFGRMRRAEQIRFIVLGLLVVAMLILGGYRAPIVLGGLTAVIAICLGSSGARFRFAVITGGLLLMVSTAVPLMRDSSKYGYYSVRATYIRQGIPEPLVLLGPIYAVAREGPLIFSILKDEMRGTSLGGRLIFSDWLSMLPGKQDNSRMIVRNLIANPTDTSKTPSVIGTLYVDFGVYGICIGMFLLSVCIHAFYEMWRRQGSVPALLLYSLSLAYGLTSIHTGGYFEPVYVLSCLFIAFVPRIASWMSTLSQRSMG